jgi:hypothetical protein
VVGESKLKFSTRVRQFAAILVVVFVLSTVWAAYYLYAETHTPAGGSPATPIATYAQGSVGGFVAAVQPSYLYNNSTEVSGGNLILFSPITNWINASISYTLETNRTAAVSLVETFAVKLSTPVWSKTLVTSLNSSSVPAATLATLDTEYRINVSEVVALAGAIDSQLDYYGSAYTLSLDPVISGTVEVGGVEQALTFEPVLNFTFAGSLITPSGLVYESTGSVLEPPHHATVSGLSGAVPYLALVGSVGGLGGSAWVATRRAEDDRLPPLDVIIRPYEEAIAGVAGPPTDATATSVSTFADLVKIADTLGKPILRPEGPDPDRRTFFVVDGLVAFTYRYPGEKASRGVSPGESEGAPDPASTPSSVVLIEQLQEQVRRLQELSLDEVTAAEARQHASRALYLIRSGAEAGAAVELEQLSRLLAAASERS